MSSSRVHQLLHTEESSQIPQWLNALRIEEIPVEVAAVDCDSPTESDWQRLLASEVELTHQCIRWLEQLARGEKVVVNLRAESDPKTLYVSVDQAWVLRVLKRITADLDNLSGHLSPIEKNAEAIDPITAGGRASTTPSRTRANNVISESTRSASYSSRKPTVATVISPVKCG